MKIFNWKKILAVVVISFSILLAGQFSFAQETLSVWGDPLAGKTIGLEAFTAIGMGNRNPQLIIASVVQVLLGFLGVMAVLLMIYGGFIWMTAGGDEEKVSRAKTLITNAVIGMLIVLSAFAIATFILRALIRSSGASDTSGKGLSGACSPEGASAACGCGGIKVCVSGVWSSCVGSDCSDGNKGRRFCDSNPLTQATCEADNKLCDTDQFCDAKDCRCSQKGGYGDPCDTDFITAGCQADNNRCGDGLSCDVNKGCVCLGGPIIKAISPVGGFCQADNNQACASDNDCSGLSPTTCDIDTPNGAVGNFVTINGSYFLPYDPAISKVFFFDGTDATIEGQLASAVNANCKQDQAWTDTQIIAVIPAGAKTGPVKIVSANGTEMTNDNSGLKGDLLINTITRPGLCQVDPLQGKFDANVNYYGSNLTAVNAYFGGLKANIKADGQPFATDDNGFATVPNIQTGLTTTFVRKLSNGIASNFLEFKKEPDDEVGPVIISFEPDKGNLGSYVTIRGRGFGRGREFSSTVYFGDTEADFSFPPECISSIWGSSQIVVKTPKGLTDKLGYNLKVKVGDRETISADKFIFDKSLSLAPSLCRIDPSFGQPNDAISLWGEYFEMKNKYSIVRFYSDQDRTDTAIVAWQTGSANKADFIKTTIAGQALTGPVRIVKGQTALAGNGLNLSIGECTKDDQCGAGEACCPAGTPAMGNCKKSIDECYGSAPSCVFEWDFTATSDNNCPPEAPNLCQDNRCCANKCQDDGSGKTVCTDDLDDRSSCAGFGNSLCLDSVLCPNSPGNCSFRSGVETTGMTCDCSLMGYPGTFYDSATNRCLDPNQKCTPPKTMKDGSGKDSPAYCANYLSYGPRWHIKTGQSCPAGFTKAAGNDKLCVNTDPNAQACQLCPSKLQCSDDGSCVSQNLVCPKNFTCTGAVNNVGGVCKRSAGLCECCCDKNKNDNNSPTKANPACCSELTCANNCGNGTGTSGEQYGSCSGCANVGTTQAEHDNACNCSTSTGKYCDMTDAATTGGICRDCGTIGDGVECSKHEACCVDKKNGRDCSAVIDGNRVPGVIPDDQINFCAYFACGTNCTPQEDGDYNTPETCTKNCGDEIDLDSCAGFGSSLCLDSILCPNSRGNCSFRSGVETTGNTCVCSMLGCTAGMNCAYDAATNSCLSDQTCSLAQDIEFNNQILTPYCAQYKGQGSFWHLRTNTSCPLPYLPLDNNSNICVNTTATGACTLCPSPLNCILNNGQPICARQQVCANNFSCKDANTPSATCTRSAGLCECCCDKRQNDQNSPTKSNPACCNGLTCANICGSVTGAGGADYGSCSGCAQAGTTQAEHDAACNCDSANGKYCDMTDSATTGGICRDCGALGSTADCTKHDACCVDQKNGNACASVAKGGARLAGTTAYCGYYSCLDDNCSVAKEYSLTAIFKTQLSCQNKCVDNSCNDDKSGQTCQANDTTCQVKMKDLSAVCNKTTCQCEKVSLVDKPCLGEGGGSCAQNCGIAYSCRGDKGCVGPDCAGDKEEEKTCTCCCDPKQKGTDNDMCRLLGEGTTKGTLNCVADQGNCTGATRGLCCGCKKDSDCRAQGEVDDSLNGCSASTCCKPRAVVVDHGPKTNNICRNPLIWADFDKVINPSTINNNVLLVGDYGSNLCPVGTTLLALNSQINESRVWYVRIWQAVSAWFARLLPFNANKVSAAGNNSNYCLVQAKARSTELDTVKGKRSRLLIETKTILSPDSVYYVIIRGDETLESKTGLKDVDDLGFKGENLTQPLVTIFNSFEYKNAQIWQFTTGADICPLDRVEVYTADKLGVYPSQKLFTGSNQVESFVAEAKSQEGQPLVSTPIYSFSWEPWTIENPELAKIEFNQSSDGNGWEPEAKVVSGSKLDGQTLLKATVKIDYDGLSAVSTAGKMKTGSSKLIFFYCKNPWPPIVDPSTWPLGWWDDATYDPNAHCDVGSDNDCLYNDFQIYYCRDQAKSGTADDLPALVGDPIIRARYIFGVDAQETRVLKDIYFFREPRPIATSSLEVLNDLTSQLGSAVVVTFGAVGDFTRYKVYYGQSTGAYNNFVSVTRANKESVLKATIKNLVNGRKYYFAITTISDLNIESAFSDELSFTVLDEVAPLKRNGVSGQAPIITAMNVNANDPQNKQIVIYWQKETEDVAGYFLDYGPNADPAVHIKLGIVNTYIIKGLNNLDKQSYFIHLRAFDQAGNDSADANYYCGSCSNKICACVEQ